MTRTRAAAAILIKAGDLGIDKCPGECYKPYQDLVSNGMAEEKARFPFGSYYLATAATPLALLTPKQLDCAEWLVGSGGEIGFSLIPKAQGAHVAKLIENGLAEMDRHGSAWKATQMLIAAINCWYKSRERVW